MLGIRAFLVVIGAALMLVMLAAGCSSGDGTTDEAAGDAGGAVPAAPAEPTAGAGGVAPDPSDSGQGIQQQFESSIVFTSPVFNEKRRIPKKSTCTEISANVPNISPPLAWEGLPDGTISLALIVDSLELEGAERVHWVMWNMPPSLTGLDEGVEHAEKLPDGTAQGTNGAGEVGYLGPCPPVIVTGFGAQGSVGEEKKRDIERYYFKLYALDTMLDLPPSTTKADLLQAIDGHILAAGELVGERQGPLSMREH
jgi:Raf kinase inhibitor-like YbhB/YbcL family protein